ncbi:MULTISPECIES: SRPBCC family protein [Streptomyces]|uniref:SRPBCC family protein n=1 Tax=Streptomyces xinghaiensis TaxID=1038928 RepID=A0A3R7EU25_9ACTN|nr:MULTISPECIES: SRPBCC family protein [Streptomyces]OFA44688.1 cyclase [Streptomyces fradiae]PQM20019.1 cyclase [Streptomyces xinghaiensis]RKM96381.1 SRPBCC family protein [Streptomyces xinghaiensis]RNC74468.1 SRPBCC family protein [Streptomyces xinghaiensis]
MAEQKGGPVPSLKENPAVDRLKQEASAFAAAQAQRLLVSAGEKLGGATARLTDVAEGRASGGSGLVKLAGDSGKKFAEGKGPVRSAVEMGATGLKDKVKEAVTSGLGKRKGGGGKGKYVTISEDVDVGVPLREAYNQWTQFQEFSTFAKGVQGVESADETTSNWRAKIFWSSRSWKASTTEQIPDERIAWTSEGAKGTLKGVVTFHALDHSLTRILMVLEYYPKGLFEKTGNIWRAQGRRARLDLKNFRRFVMMRGEATGEWRGEIRDGEVVRSHEEVLETEREDEDLPEDAHEEDAGPEEDGEPSGPDEKAPHGDAEDSADDEEDEEHPEDAYEEEGLPEEAYDEDEAAEEEELPEEDAEYEADEEDPEYAEDEEPEPAGTRR